MLRLRVRGAHLMSKVMKANAAVDLAYAEFDFADTPEVWLTFGLAFDDAALAYWIANSSSNCFGTICNAFGAPDGNFKFTSGVPEWTIVGSFTATSPTPTPVADTWVLIELHYAADGTIELYINGTLALSAPSFHENVGMIRVGQDNGAAFDVAAISYARDVKAGTTRGGTDLFADDFSSGDFSAWSSTFGDVSIVDDPFLPPSPPIVFADLPVRVFVTDLNSETITIMDRRATDKQFLFTLNAPAYHTGQVASDDPEVNTAFPLPTSQANLAQASRLCYALQRQKGSDPPYQPIFGGIVTIIQDQGTDAPTTRYTAHDPWQYMMSRPAINPDSGSPVGADGYTYPNNTRGSDIALEQLLLTELHQGETHIDSGGTTSPLFEATDPLPPFTIDQGQSVGEVWTALTETGTIDIHMVPIYDPDARPGKVVEFQTVRQSEGVAAGPVLYDIVMAWDKPGNSLMGINNLIDATRLANRAQFITANGVAEVADDPASEAVYGIYYAQQTFPGISDPSIVALLATAEVLIRRNGARTISFDPAPERVEQPFKDYNLGDYLPVWASRNLRQPLGVDYDSFDANNPGASGYQRIYAIPLAVDDNGVSRVTGLLTSKEN